MRTQLTILFTFCFLSLFLFGCGQNEMTVTRTPKQPTAKINTNQETLSCSSPTPEILQNCRAIEEKILASTLRIQFREWQSEGDTRTYIERGTSHGTVKDGRYLITHNHFSLPLTQMQNNAEGARIKVSISRVNGEVILQDMPLTAFTVVFEDEQLLIFDFLSYGDQGLFEMLEIPSAQFMAWQDAHLQVGTEIAQLNWDGQTAHVEWAHIRAIHDKENAPHIELDNFLQPGASGGGVFLNGVHIANNWARLTELDDSGSAVEQYSIAALNVMSVEI